MQLLSAQPDFIITDEDGILIGSSGGTSLLTGGTEGQAPIVQGDGSIAWGAAGASSLSELDDWDTDTLVVPGDLIVRQSGGIAGTDEIQIYHDGTDAHIFNQEDTGWLNLTPRGQFGTKVRTQITSKTGAFAGARLELVKGGAASSAMLSLQHAQGHLYAIAQGYASGDYDQTYAAYIHHSTSGSKALYIASDTTVNLLAGGAGDEFITAIIDSQGLTVLQPGGVAGTDELQIYHDGTHGYIQPQSGGIIFGAGAYNIPSIALGSTSNYFSVAGGVWCKANGANAYVATNTKMSFRSNMSITWSANTSFPNNLDDVGLSRSSSGLLKVNNASTGWGALMAQGLGLNERSADPSDPSEGQSVLWQSDGTGSGDDGDIMIKITAGGVTKTTTLVDFSTL